jgi:hypothetical protein
MGIKRRREFEEGLKNVLAKLGREGVDRIERSQVEEIGQRFELDPDDARKLFVKSRGYIWKGEFVESDEEPGWEAVELERIPSVGSTPEESSL